MPVFKRSGLNKLATTMHHRSVCMGVWVWLCLRVRACMRVRVYVCLCACAYVCVRACGWVCVDGRGALRVERWRLSATCFGKNSSGRKAPRKPRFQTSSAPTGRGSRESPKASLGGPGRGQGGSVHLNLLLTQTDVSRSVFEKNLLGHAS